MANRFYVGGTADWNATAGSKWATTSGGAGGAAVPTTSDDVFFDAASGASVVTIKTAQAQCKTLNFTGFTGTLTFDGSASCRVDGSLTFGSGMTLTSANSFFYMGGGTGTITFNGKIPLVMEIDGGAITAGDNLSFGERLTLSSGSFNANNMDITAGRITSSGTGTRTLTMGSGTWLLTGASGEAWDTSTVTNLTLNANTSTIKISSGPPVTFKGGGKTFNNYWNNISTVTISGSNTFNDFKINSGSVQYMTDGSTQTVSTITAIGTSGAPIEWLGTGAGGWAISDASGTNTIEYVNLENSTASGGATFNAINSTNVGGNVGWNFPLGFTAGVGAFSLSGVSVGATFGRKFESGVGQFILSGMSAEFTFSGIQWANEDKSSVSSFLNTAKNSESFLNTAKNLETFANSAKNSSTFINPVKNSATFSNVSKS